MNNPLQQYFRAPKLYVKLPSQASYYGPEEVDLTANGEVAVYPMTAMDQILIRTPDALLNGDAMIKVISSCVPGIKHPKKLVEPDINTLFVAIRIATSGAQLQVDGVCPSCGHENTYEVDLNAMIETQSIMDVNSTMEMDGSLLLHLKPYDFEQRNLTLLNEIQETQAVSLIQNNSDMSDVEKLTKLGQHMSSMAERTFEIAAKSISHITVIKTGESVTDRQFIEEFMKNITKDQAEQITNKIKEMNKTGVDTQHNFECASCGHAWSQPVDLDPASFFG